jgi:hypothetical protein
MTSHVSSHLTAIPDGETLAALAGEMPGLMGRLHSDHAGETGAMLLAIPPSGALTALACRVFISARGVAR